MSRFEDVGMLSERCHEQRNTIAERDATIAQLRADYDELHALAVADTRRAERAERRVAQLEARLVIAERGGEE